MMVLGLATNGYAFQYAKAKVTFKVIDEQGIPVENALIGGAFHYAQPSSPTSKNQKFKGESNKDGLFSVSGKTHGEVAYYVKKDGYYRTFGYYREWFKKGATIKYGKWQPWDPTVEVVLRKVINPVPMYSKQLHTTVPVLGKPVGFDLEKGDWVSPHGSGLVNDFIVTLSGEYRAIKDRNATLRITFDNQGDGIQAYPVPLGPYGNTGSDLRLPHQAPASGYEASWHREKYIKPDGSRKNLGPIEEQNYIFRVRTVLDEKGNIVRANYGKIWGGVQFDVNSEGKGVLLFDYFYNPDGTSNLEHAAGCNLFEKSR